MADKLKEIPAKILEWWNKFTSKQKTIIIAIVAIVIFAFAILVYAISKPQYTKIGTYSSTAESAEVVDILDDAGITHRESADALTIEVETSQLYQANLALGASGIVSDGMPKYSDYVDSSMSTTSSDKEKQWRGLRQAELEKMIETMSPIKNATVILNIPPQNGTLAAQQEESSAFITLELDGVFSSANATYVARAVATSLGNATTANITILDSDGNALFVGGDDYSVAGVANSLQELKNQAESMVANQVKKVLYGTKQYNLIEVTSYLDMDYSNYEETVKEYYANADRTEGMKAHEEQYEAENSNGAAGAPGTDTNDGNNLTGYVNPDYNSSESTEKESLIDYLPNESSNYKVTPAGGINYENSSMAIAMITYREYYEENVENQGLLDGTSWEEFKEANGADIRKEVDEEYYRMAAMATGISQDKISIIAYESPIFYDKEGFQASATDVVSIVMIVLILALLGFVVLRSMRSRKAEPEEEELSVESMLQSTPETVLEDIDVESKSETRKMVEKFVDENPEAAANLLRNWLNDDWG